MTASEYAGEQEDTSDEVDELESQRDEIDESSDGDDVQVSVPSKVIDMQLILVLIVQVAKIAKDKGKSVSSRGREKKKKRKPKVLAGDEDSSSGKGDSRGRPMLRELPKEVRTLVNRANVFLRVILSLENAWTAEKKYGHEVLPEKHTILKRALGEVWGLKDDQGQPLKHVELAFGMLNTEKAHDLREAVFSLVRAWATVEPY